MKLPVVSAKEVIKALSKIGYYVRDQKGESCASMAFLSKAVNHPGSSSDSEGYIKSYNKGGGFDGRRILGTPMMQCK
jgi:hypothetical protein